jgi:predicted nucleic acid-binding Zn ribbon protein
MSPEKLRQRVLAEWRGLPATPFSRDTAQLVAGPLAKLMKSLGLGDRLREEEVKRAWGEIAGEFIAGQSSPDTLRAGVLTVRVVNSPLLFELNQWKPELLQKLKARFGARTVREIKFRIG